MCPPFQVKFFALGAKLWVGKKLWPPHRHDRPLIRQRIGQQIRKGEDQLAGLQDRLGKVGRVGGSRRRIRPDQFPEVKAVQGQRLRHEHILVHDLKLWRRLCNSFSKKEGLVILSCALVRVRAI